MQFSLFHKKHPAETQQQYRLCLREGFTDALKMTKGIKNDRDLAHQLGITPGFLSLLKSGKRTVSDEVIIRFAVFMGSTRQGWDAPFEIRPEINPAPLNSSKNNMRKYRGELPHDRFSTIGPIREKDRFSE